MNEYNWQCLNGHIGDVAPNTELEMRAKKRAAEGKLDAICLHHSECPECQEEARKRDRRWSWVYLDKQA